tara:strand:- start:175 stop:534 length:360 start_codon:yes stop_codon:yes gene_type:complete
MFNDEQIQHWIADHGTATSFTFIVYSKIQEFEVDLLIRGLVLSLHLPPEFESKIAIFYDNIDEEQAVAWKAYRGTSISFVFAGDFSDLEKEIKQIVLEGLEYLRYKSDYLGTYSSGSYV